MFNRGLRYNEVTMKLTLQEIQLFRHNGFIKFPTKLTKEHVDSLKAQSLSDMKEEIEPLVRKDGRPIRISNVCYVRTRCKSVTMVRHAYMVSKRPPRV